MILPNVVFATPVGEMIIGAMILCSALALTPLVSAFIKYWFCNHIYLKKEKISIKPFFGAMAIEMAIIIVALWMFFNYPYKAGRDFDIHFTIFLSYLSTDVALFYFQKMLVENQYVLSLITKELIFGFMLSIIVFIPNYRLFVKVTKEHFSKQKQWLHAYFFSALVPIIIFFVLSSFLVAGQGFDSIKFNPKYNIENLMKEAFALGSPRLIDVVISKGGGINAHIGDKKITALHKAVESGNVDTVRLVLQKGGDVNSRNTANLTPLMTACAPVSASIKIVQLLIDNGADINTQCHRGETALKIASRRHTWKWEEKQGVKDINIEKLLLDRGADPNIADARGITPLMEASLANDLELVKLLIDSGADVNSKSIHGFGAYIFSSDPEVKQILINHGAEILEIYARIDKMKEQQPMGQILRNFRTLQPISPKGVGVSIERKK